MYKLSSQSLSEKSHKNVLYPLEMAVSILCSGYLTKSIINVVSILTTTAVIIVSIIFLVFNFTTFNYFLSA